MSLTQENFLILNAVVVTLIVISILSARRGAKKPVQLRMMNPPDAKTQKAAEQQKLNGSISKAPGASAPPPNQSSHTGSQQPPGWQNYRPRPRPPVEEAVRKPAQEKSLNVLFNWNGHSWDAYEVLGIPAGSSLEVVQAAYLSARASADPQSLPFLKAALEAILNS